MYLGYINCSINEYNGNTNLIFCVNLKLKQNIFFFKIFKFVFFYSRLFVYFRFTQKKHLFLFLFFIKLIFRNSKENNATAAAKNKVKKM